MGSLNDMCDKTIKERLMTYSEKAGIMAGDKNFEKASRFLEHFALKMDGPSSALQVFKKMLKELGTLDAAEVLKKMGRCLWCILWGSVMVQGHSQPPQIRGSFLI